MHIWRKKFVNYDKFKIATNCINQIFNLNKFFFFLFTGATLYYHTICLEITYFVSFTDYEDDIFEVISNRHGQGLKFGGKITKFGSSTEFMELVFPSLKGKNRSKDGVGARSNNSRTRT